MGITLGMMYNKENEMQFSEFKLGLNNIEKMLTTYEKDVQNANTSFLKETLECISRKIKRKMIIFVITDLNGLDSIDENIAKKITATNDMLIFNINDAYMTGGKAYDMESSSYIPNILLNDRKLYELERKTRKEIYTKCEDRLKKYNIQIESISEEKEIVSKIINLLERHRHASIS